MQSHIFKHDVSVWIQEEVQVNLDTQFNFIVLFLDFRWQNIWKCAYDDNYCLLNFNLWTLLFINMSSFFSLITILPCLITMKHQLKHKEAVNNF